MLILLKGGRIVDPYHQRDEIADLWIEDGRVIRAPQGRQPDQTHDVSGKIVMAGAIDIHSHIAGGNVNTARLLLPELHRARAAPMLPLGTAKWSTYETGTIYAGMGFTTVVEPAVAPHQALQAHLELSDIPIIDKATLTILGNDDFLLSLLRDGESPAAIADYVAATLTATHSLGLKCINAGGAEAFKYNARTFSLDDVVPFYGVSSRKIVEGLQQALTDLKVPHPLHLHSNNLGVPGNVATALATIEASRGLPLHLAHMQFYGYGSEGEHGFSSAAATLAAKVNATPNVTVDIGQVMFGQTVTISADVLRQFGAAGSAKPKKSVILDGDANGFGIVPYLYREGDFINAIQWAVGLELFLLINDPYRIFFTTDHPNGAPFTTYPDIFALLMSKERRAEVLSRIPQDVLAYTTLPSLTREYDVNEIATMTRAAPAKLFGFKDRGQLGEGAVADVAVYSPNDDIAKMFRHAHLVFKDGDLVVRDGRVSHYRWGKTLKVNPGYDKAINRRLSAYYERHYGISHNMFAVPAHILPRTDPFKEVACAQ
ncbi:Formyltransferase/hydrolase complex Fhc subunit A [Methylocella tundrae]|uniref:Formyltransferase/hydrolase complex Fhc subunit A n=1 Tax=Methylocella tundrae TaxID=227605 RepID=A0A8B6M041_METTU|nr:formylmethanofuran dehydrogenase subunit A [Methylocella tundrae]VTZ26288.1 Formyltransferase/hydrolase complex Fhc subunit A [Methylocella tundrae]VTZ48124.1 Formyltransferase/hydrolase complex Fhc subunit A [Methylocella tundrae]